MDARSTFPLLVSGEHQLIGVNSTILEPGRKAFTCAHEIGHYNYDVVLSGSFLCTRDDLGYGKTKNDQKETRANEFASELLMPHDLFLAQIQRKEPSWKFLGELAQTFQTSLQATANRFVKLTDHICWLVVVKNGLIQRYTKADHNEFTPKIKKSFKPPTSDPEKFMDTFADSWLNANRNTKNKRVMYWPLPKNRYGECPILLWDQYGTLLDDNFVSDEFDEEMSRMDDNFGRY